jgi:release factor glutamine methyltransferase
VKTTAKSLLKELIESLNEIYDEGESISIGKIILEDIVGIPGHQLPLDPPVDLSTEEEQRLSNAMTRLKEHEPIQYVTGRCYFYGRIFKVNPGVLIPRPETEELVALIVSRHKDQKELKIVDIGTGSGCIAISLAAALPSAEVTAVDISEAALAVAKENAKLNSVYLTTQKLDITTEPLSSAQYDIIVSNPPYITESERILMHENVLEHEPDLALFVPNEDPLRFYAHIAEQGKDALRPNGRIYCEINEHFGAETMGLFEKLGYQNVELHKDMQGKDRMVSCQSA